MTFKPFLCKICGYTSFNGEPHKCNPRIRQSSFYSRRYSKCISCIYNTDGVCSVDRVFKSLDSKISDFYEQCPRNFWLPVIFRCKDCSKAIICTDDSLLKCPYCGSIIHRSHFGENFVKRSKKVLDIEKNPYDLQNGEMGIEDLKNSTIHNYYTISLIRKSKSVIIAQENEIIHKELVVAHFNENLDWINHVPDSIDRITIYNKGSFKQQILPNDSRIKIIKISNIGREADTWLYHFISRRNSLADITYLAQGDPLIHSPNFLDLIDEEYDKPVTLTKLYTIDHSFRTAGSFRKRVQDININFNNNTALGIITYTPTFFKSGSMAVWDKVFSSKIPDTMFFGYGAMYALPRESILFRSDSFYRLLMESKISAYQIEGLWYYIFNKFFNTVVK